MRPSALSWPQQPPPLGRAFATGSGASGSAGSSGASVVAPGQIDQKKVLLERIAKARSEALAAEKPDSKPLKPDSKPLDINEDLG